MMDPILWIGVIAIGLAAAGAISARWWWKCRQVRLTEMWAGLRRERLSATKQQD